MNHRLHEPSGQKNKRSVTADYNAVGVRPSSGAASTGCSDASDSIGARSRSDIAAPEDGRTPPRRSPAVADPVHKRTKARERSYRLKMAGGWGLRALEQAGCEHFLMAKLVFDIETSALPLDKFDQAQ